MSIAQSNQLLLCNRHKSSSRKAPVSPEKTDFHNSWKTSVFGVMRYSLCVCLNVVCMCGSVCVLTVMVKDESQRHNEWPAFYREFSLWATNISGGKKRAGCDTLNNSLFHLHTGTHLHSTHNNAVFIPKYDSTYTVLSVNSRQDFIASSICSSHVYL